MITWLINKQLSDYLNVFNENFDVSYFTLNITRNFYLLFLVFLFEFWTLLNHGFLSLNQTFHLEGCLTTLNFKGFSEGLSSLDWKLKQWRHNLVSSPRWEIELLNCEIKAFFSDRFQVAWIDKIDRRYAWLKRILIQFEEDYQNTFPGEWGVEERICLQFCNISRWEINKYSLACARFGFKPLFNQ